MKNIIINLIFILFCSNLIQSQSGLISGNPFDELSTIFNQKSISVDIMDDLKTDPRQLELTYKLKIGIEENYDWFQDYIKKTEKGKTLKYHPNFGITESEYNDYLRLSENVEIISSGKEIIEITRDSGKISFLGQQKTSIYNDLIIDLENQKIIFKNKVLDFTNEIIVTDNDNGLRSKWKGYNWEFTNPGFSEETDIRSLEKFTTLNLTIGQLEKNGKIYMKIQERSMVEGIKTVDNQVPVLF